LRKLGEIYQEIVRGRWQKEKEENVGKKSEKGKGGQREGKALETLIRSNVVF
jgi:hypothetical protein